MEMFSVEILANDFCIPMDFLGIKNELSLLLTLELL